MKRTRKYRVEDINKWNIQPIFVEANNVREAIKIALGIKKVKRDNSGNILVKSNVADKDRCYARWQSWIYSEVKYDE